MRSSTLADGSYLNSGSYCAVQHHNVPSMCFLMVILHANTQLNSAYVTSLADITLLNVCLLLQNECKQEKIKCKQEKTTAAPVNIDPFCLKTSQNPTRAENTF